MALDSVSRNTLDESLVPVHLKKLEEHRKATCLDFVKVANTHAFVNPDDNSKKVVQEILTTVSNGFKNWMDGLEDSQDIYHHAIPNILILSELFTNIFYGAQGSNQVKYFHELAEKNSQLLKKIQGLAERVQSQFPENYFPKEYGEYFLYRKDEESAIRKIWKDQQIGTAFDHFGRFVLELEDGALDAAFAEVALKIKLVAYTIYTLYLKLVEIWTKNHWNLQAEKSQNKNIKKYAKWYNITTGEEFFKWVQEVADSNKEVNLKNHTHLYTILYPSNDHFDPKAFGEEESVDLETLFLRRKKIIQNSQLKPLNEAMQELRKFYLDREAWSLSSKPDFAGLQEVVKRVHKAMLAFDLEC
ncbi:MAG: hypothetical protein SNF33_01535 [Candidatus Algichlamydia australiensis]|nr:hypothetical protein [Chlamydiales bacterium]